MTPDRETAVRLAMIAAGYGEGFTMNVDVDRLYGYARHPEVAAQLQPS